MFWFTHWHNVFLGIVLKTVALKLCSIFRKISTTEFTVLEVTVCRVTIFLNEAVCQIYFLGVHEMFIITNNLNLKG